MGTVIKVLPNLFFVFAVLLSNPATAGERFFRVVDPRPHETLLCIVSFGTALNKESEVILKIEAEVARVDKRTPSESRIDLFSLPLNELDTFAKKAKESKDSLFGDMLQYRLDLLEKHLSDCGKVKPFEPDAQQAIETLKKGMAE